MKVVYVAGPYMGKTKEERDKNIDEARDMAIKVWEAGFYCLCPHMNTSRFDELSNVSEETYLKGYLEILKRCDAMLLLPRWKESKGAVKERNLAVIYEIPVYHDLDELIKSGDKK